MLRDRGELEHIVLCRTSIISVAGATGTQCNSSDSHTKKQIMDRLASHLPLKSMDCDFELLHSRAMVLPGKKICGEKGRDRKGQRKEVKSSYGDGDGLEHIAPPRNNL